MHDVGKSGWFILIPIYGIKGANGVSLIAHFILNIIYVLKKQLFLQVKFLSY